MTAIISRDWRRSLLTAIVEQGVMVHLYRNDYTPEPDTQLADFEEVALEAGGNPTGYAPVAIPAAEWVMSESLPIARHESGVRFAFAAPVGMVYGYYLTTRGGVYVGGERADRFPLDVRAFDGIQIMAQISI